MAKIYSSGNTLFIGSDVAPIDSGVVATAVTDTGYTDHVKVANTEGLIYVIAPYNEIFEEDGTTNWGTDVTSTVNNLNTLFGNNNPNNYADKTKLDTAVSRINAAEADIATNTSDIATNVLDISDIKKAVQIDLGAGRGIFADDGKGNTKSYLKVADSQAVIQGGVLTRINISEASPGSHSFTVAAGPAGSETEYEALELYGKTNAGTATLELKNGTALGFVNGSYATTFRTDTLTAARTIALPDASGTVALTSDIPSFVGYVDTTGTPANNQVAVFTDQDTIEGSTALIVDGANVGIGTTTPSEALHVVGKATINDGSNNVLISSGNSTIASSNTTAVGYQALTALTTGAGNTAVGYQAGAALTTNSSVTAVGYQAAYQLATGNIAVAVGYHALENLTTVGGDYGALAIGVRANENKTSLTNSTSIGNRSNAGSEAVAVGGASNASGAGSTAVGQSARAGAYSTVIGHGAGDHFANVARSVLIGRDAGGTNVNSDSVMIGHQAGSQETGTHKLYIENSNSTTPLIYGEFDNDIVRINGDFKVRLPGESYDSLSVGETIVLKPSDNSAVPNVNNAAVYIDRDGSTSTDVVALHIGDKLKIKRNGGGTPIFDVDNGAFIYTQNYNGYTATNTSPFNNGSGMGIRNTTPGSPVICALLINGVFGALNTAGSTLNIGNPNGCNNNWAQAQGVSFRNTSFFGVRRGEESNYGAEDGYVIRHQENNTDSVSDYRNGLQLSATPNIGVSTNNGRVYATNGSNVLNADTLGFDVRSFVTVGDILYIDETAGTSLGTSWAVHTVTAVDSVNETITIDSNWAGTTGTVGAWIERNIVTVRNWDGDVMTRVKGTGEFQIGNDSAGYKLPSTDGTADQVLSTDGSGNVTWVDTTLEGLPNVVSALTNNEILTYNSTLGYWVGGNSVTLNSVNTNNLTVNSSATFSSAISAPSFLLTSDGESEISVGVLSDDLALKSAGNVRVLLDKDNNETGQKFLVEDPSSTERFSVDDAGVATFNNAYSLPNTDGTSGQVLTTNGSGAASWADAGGGKSSSASGYLEIKSDSMTQLFVGPTNGIFAADYTTGNNDNQSYSHNGTAPTAGSSTISKYPYNVRSGLLDVHHDISTISFNARLRDVSQNAASCEYWVCIWHLSGGAAETFTSQTWTAAAVGTGTFGASSVNTLLSKVVATASGLSISAGDSLWITFGWVDQPAGTPDIPVNWSINMNE